jgi:hypothetical protein
MSKLEVNAVEPQCGTNLTLGASGDTIIIPSGATISNQGTAAGFGPTGAVSWNTTKITADPNPAVTGVGYFADTTSAAFTITLPSSPSAGAVVGIADYANTFATNNLTVDRNGSNIGGVAANAELSTNGLSVTFVYVDATQGWIVTDSGNRSDLPAPEYVAATGGTITTCGDYKIHTFTGPGTFTVSCAGNPLGSTTVDYLVVAGGGSGGFGVTSYQGGGGGGAGGYRESSGAASGCYSVSTLGSGVSALPVSVQGYPVTVGGGGATNPSPSNTKNDGSPSVFSTITSTGGGGGGIYPASSGNGNNGGSGGGGGSQNCGAGAVGGTGNSPPVAPAQGTNGGNGNIVAFGPSNPHNGGGGGGATVAGTAATGPQAGPGGTGATSSINGTPTARAGGGGGGSQLGSAGTASGGGAAGGANAAGSAGTVNTGGGGGGGGQNSCTPGGVNGGAGGSGIVVIRYKYQ